MGLPQQGKRMHSVLMKFDVLEWIGRGHSLLMSTGGKWWEGGRVGPKGGKGEAVLGM